jgi:decaprenyl-phosphate phosphoribosyltransferase
VSQGRPTLAKGLLKTARPKQWAKNVLVFAAPAAAGVLDEWHAQWRVVLAFIAFCMAASGTYFFNDIADIEADRLHPRKRNRPIAAGVVPVSAARVVGAVLLVGAVVVAALTFEWPFVVVILSYIVLTLSYSAYLKHVAVIDLVAVALGFVLRAVGGATAVGVPASNWFIITTSFGSLFIVAGKRYAEIDRLGDDAAAHRPILDAYSPNFLRLVLAVSCSGTVLGYCLWAFERGAQTDANSLLFQLSIIPVVTAVLRYALELETGRAGAPEDVFAHDRPLQLLGLAWAALFMAGVYFG